MSTPDAIDPKFWLDLLQWLVLGLISFVTFVRKPGEQAVREIADLKERMVRIEATQDAQKENLVAIKTSVQRIEDFLLHKA